MSHNRDLSAAAAQLGFHSSNIGIGTDAPSETITLNHANGASIGLEYAGSEHGTLNVNSAAMYVRAGSGKHLILGGNATESLRITSAGNIGVGVANPTQKLMVKGIIASEATNSTNNWMGYTYTDNTFRLNYNGAGADEVTITSSGLVGINDTTPDATLSVGGSTAFVDIGAAGGNRAKIGYSSNDCYFGTSSSSGQFIFKNNVSSNDNPASSGVERLRIDNAGTLLVNATIDNAGGHGRIVAHAPTTGNTIYKAIEIGNTSADGTGRGAAICGQPKSNSHLPYTLIGSWDHGDNTDVYYGGGWGGAMRPATRHRFYVNSSYPTTGTSGTEVIRITENGDLGINTLNPQEKLHIFIAKNSGTSSADRTKQHAAMRLSLDRTSGSMPYQGWGPALDFYSDNYDGSTQRPNARIAGVISNYSLGDEGGELRFYTTPTDTATSESDFAHRMSITSAGYVLKTQQPAFFVYRNQSTWSLAANAVFVFNTAELNVGNHYNTSNGRFTAPITGRYVFHFWSIYTGTANNDYVQMYKNGARIMGGDVHFTNTIGNSWDSVHYSRVIQLSGGDYVYMRSGSAHQYHGNNWGGWSGYLLG